MFRCTPGAELEPGEVGEARHDVDPPAEVLGAARRGADPQVQRRGGAEAARRAGRARRAAARRRSARRPRSARASGAGRASAGRAAATRRAPSGRASSSIATMRSRRLHLLPGRGRRAGCRPSCAWRRRRSARARGRRRRARSPARRAGRGCAGSDAPPSRRSLTSTCTYAAPAARGRACARASPPSRPPARPARDPTSEVTGRGALTITSWAPARRLRGEQVGLGLGLGLAARPATSAG